VDILGAFSDYLRILLSFLVWLSLFFLALTIGKRVLDSILFKSRISKKSNRDSAVLFVKIPPDNDQKEQAMEEFLKALHRVLPNNTHVSLEMVSNNQFLRFYIIIPKEFRGILESQLYAQYPHAEIEEQEDYLQGFGAGSAIEELFLKRSSVYPINTYHNLKENLLKNLSAILSKTESGETVIVQLALKKVGSKFWNRNFSAFRYGLSSGSSSPANAKLSRDLYMGKLRVAYVSSDKFLSENKLKTLLGLYKLVKGPFNELRKKKFSFSKISPLAFSARVFQNGDLWAPEELATLYHFPYSGSVVSNVVQSTSRRAPAPDILPREGLVDPKEVSFIGETNFRNDNYKFGIKRIDRRRHMYVVGKTGSGKSRLLELLLISDIQNGAGCCLLDPHGDLADELLMFVPKERINDVVYVNPTDRDFPIGFNPLEPVENFEERQHLSRFLISIFKKLFAENWNARMEHLIRYITLALLETPDSNVLGITRMLSDTNFRQRVIKQIQDPVVKGFWTNEFSTSNEQFISAAAVPIINKVGQFISNPIVRNMVGQRKNMLDFEKFMNEGKIVIINLSKGKLGEENAALLGSMFITKIQQAALARAKFAEEERRDFYFYVDEFQNFATDAFSSILSEARKYHLDLTIAHQYIAQLPEDVKATAFGNVGTIITFAIGGDDAAYLAKEFAPVFTPDDMINLNTREMYIKMSIDGKLSPPFSARTIDVPKPQFDHSVSIVNHSRMTYGKNRVSVENEIRRWADSTEIIDDPNEEAFPQPII